MTPRYALFSTLAATVALAPVHAQTKTVGTLSVVRQVEVTRSRTTPDIRDRVERELAKQGETVFVEQGFLTHKRALAELAINDGTVIRLNERTEAILSEAHVLWLRTGAAWVHDKGAGTRVDTPAGTVTGKGATFEVIVVSPTETWVYCYEGEAQLGRSARTVKVASGEGAGVVLKGANIALENAEKGTVRSPWWRAVEEERGLLVVPGSSIGFALRSSALAEAIQATHNLPPKPGDIVKNPADKARLLSIAQGGVVPSIERTLASDATLTLSGYRQKFGGADLTQQYTLSGNDLGFLRANGIANVGDLFDALNAAGAGFGLDIRSVHPTRLAYRPSAWEGAGNTKARLIDGTDSSSGLIALGAAMAALLDGKGKASEMTTTGEAFGFTADPQAIGGRIRLGGTYGKTSYQVEGNLVRLLSGTNSKNSSALSVASFERDMGNGVTAFAGRRRFYSGPVLQGLDQSQLIGERYTSVGATARRGEWTLQGAYLYDSNADIQGAQSGFLASATRRAGGGTMGFQVLRAGSLNNGTGFSVSGALPVTPGQLDLYGEVGVAPDKASIATIGAYFPEFFQKWDTDFFVEYSTHEGLGHSLLVTASREMTPDINLRAFIGQGQRAFRSSNDTFGGLGLSLRFGK